MAARVALVVALLDSLVCCAGTRSPAAQTTIAAPACAPDIATRAPDAERVEGFDIDGDGDEDLVFRSGHDMHGNAMFHFYRVDGACAVYLGAIESFVMHIPQCVPAAAPRAGQVCRLSAELRMFHDDYQETFYENVGGAFVEAGHGRYTRPPPRRPR